MLATFGLQAFAFSQSGNALSLKQNLHGEHVDDHNAFYKLASCVSDSVIYTVSYFPTPEKRFIYWYDLRTGKHDKMELERTKKSRLHSSNIYALQKYREDFILMGADDMFVVQKQSSGKCKLFKTIRNQDNFHLIKPLGDRFFVYIDYEFHRLDADHRHIWAYLNPRTYEIENFTVQPEQNTWLSYFVNSWIDVYGEKIAYASTTDYKVRILDKDFRVIDSIATNDLSGNNAFIPGLRVYNTDSKDGIMQLRDHETKVLTRIRKVYFLNDTTISVLLHPAVTDSLKMDSLEMHFWQKQNGAWTRIRVDKSTSWFQKGQSYSASRIPYNDFYQNVFDLPYLGGYNFCEVYYPYISNVDIDKFDVDRDYYSKQNEAIHSKKTNLGVKLIRMDPASDSQ